ncbi:MAG TPA: ABC transporter permease [Bryobacteraceae bacterium]|jgi:putative ABC transport system permease protein
MMMRRLVGILLYLFPAGFRRAFGADMLAAFDDRWSERRGFRVGPRIVFDLIASAVRERVASGRQRNPVEAEVKGESTMAILWRDICFACRTLLKSPAFTVVALVTIALGIGINTAMFSVANAVLWRSLPFPAADRIMWVGEVSRANASSAWGTTYLNFRDWQARSHSFEKLAGILNDERILRHGGEPTRVQGSAVTREFFETLAVAPEVGRIFTASDEQPGTQPAIVLSDALWRRRFGADPSIVGQTIHFDDLAATVIGVMPATFAMDEAEYWLPLDPVIDRYFTGHRDVWVLTAIGRLLPGHDPADAQREVEGIMAQIREAHPETKRDLVVKVTPLGVQLSRDLRPAVLALLGAVGVVLLIACANLAGLMSLRASARAREMAIRRALGAGRGRMIRQLLTECAVLAVAGGVAGIGVAYASLRGLSWLSPEARVAKASIDLPVLLFALAATLVTSLLFGAAPAITAARVDAIESLGSGARTSGGKRRAFARQVLVVAQVALCLLLLTGAGLLFRSLRRVLDVDPGFRVDHLASMRVELPNSYKTVTAVVGVYSRFMDGLKSMPGATGVTMVNALPISGGDSSGDLTIDGIASGVGELGTTSFRRAPPGYFEAMGIPLVRGREFAESDDVRHERVVIINESMARRFWPGQDPNGHRIKIGPRNNTSWLTIVGVVKDVRNVTLDADAGFATYQPFAQQPRTAMTFAIRTAGDPMQITAAAQRVIRGIEPLVMIDHVQTMSQRIGATIAPRRLNLTLFGLFSLFALVLAAIGLYGVVAYAAGQRTREYGIRMALGARSGDVLWLVLGQGLKLAVIGAVIGLAAAVELSGFIAKLLFGVEPTDPLTLAAVAALVACVATAASWLPAYRATRIAPTEALRLE